MTAKDSLIVVVDDDESVRDSLSGLLQELGFATRSFAGAEEFLRSGCIDEVSCLILDISMPGMTGPDLQRELLRQRQSVPIIFITAHADEALRQRLLELGAVGCLTKPFGDTTLLEVLKAALGVR